MSEQTIPRELRLLLEGSDKEDRAFAAFRLGGEETSAAVLAALRRCLADDDADVVRYAAQSLAVHNDIDSLAALLSLLESEPGSEATPVAWAVATLAARTSPPLRHRARNALARLGTRGSEEVAAQIEILLQRLDSPE